MENHGVLYATLRAFVISSTISTVVYALSMFGNLSPFMVRVLESVLYYFTLSTLVSPVAVAYMYAVTKRKSEWWYLLFPVFNVLVAVGFIAFFMGG
jgi:hypothetical protein